MHLSNALYGKVYKKIGCIPKATGNVSKVALIQQRIDVMNIQPPLFHVGLVIIEKETWYISEHGPIRYDPYRSFKHNSVTIELPSVHNTIADVQEFELLLPTKYIMGIRDCRHHVLDVLDYLYFSHGSK
jgi:hypothetical protein